MKVAVICSGSSKTGLGHLFRARSFVNYAKKKSNVKVFAIVEKGLETIFHDHAEITQILYSEETLTKKVLACKPDVIVFDLLFLTNSTFKKLKETGCLLVSISPIFDRMQGVDMLFVRSKYFTPINGVEIYGGLEYTIVNQYSQKISTSTFKRNLKKKHLPVAISMGGTDAPNKTLKVIKKLSTFPHSLTLWVALGEGYAHSYTEIVESIKKSYQHEIILAKASKSTWDIMGNAVLTILAGGLTTIESVIAGIPSINVFEKEEHIKLMPKELIDLDVTMNTSLLSDDSLDYILEKVNNYYFNREELLAKRNKMEGLIDKKGPERVFNAIKTRLNSATGKN